MSIAKKMVASGPRSAQVRRYLTAVSRSAPSAPISLESGSAAKIMIVPMTTEAIKIIMTEQENTLFAVSLSS